MKLFSVIASPISATVAPCAGAGIEIEIEDAALAVHQSPPARGRGLKFVFPAADKLRELGRPLRGGGD